MEADIAGFEEIAAQFGGRQRGGVLHILQRPLRKFPQVIAAGVLVHADQAHTCIGTAAIGLHGFGHLPLHFGNPQAFVVQMVAQRAQDQAFGIVGQCRLDHDRAFGDGPRIANGAGGIGRTDQHDQLASLAQRVAGDGGVAVMKGLETPDKDEIVVRCCHENPSRLRGQPVVCPLACGKCYADAQRRQARDRIGKHRRCHDTAVIVAD